VVPLLLAAGADVNAKAVNGRTSLLYAIKAKHTAVVPLLLEAGADVNAAADDGLTALHLACSEGLDEVVSLLLAAGADVAAKTAGGCTPLMCAVEGEHAAMVPLLLAAGADPAASAGGKTVLHSAATAGDVLVVQQLLAAMSAVQRSSTMDAVHSGMTALHWAVEGGHTSCVQALLAAGADPDKLLGADAVDGDDDSIEGHSPLYRAVDLDYSALVPLLATPTNLRQVCGEGDTPLTLAIVNGKLEMAQLLVGVGSPAGLRDPEGFTAMQLAVQSTDPAMRALLPAMVRGECRLYLEQQQEGKEGQQQGQQQAGQEEEQQQDPAAVLAVVADAVCDLLKISAAPGPFEGYAEAVSIFSAVMDVLEEAAASSLLQQVVQVCEELKESEANSQCALQLIRAVHSGWVAALEPLLQQRQKVTSRLQWLVTQPLAQRAQVQEAWDSEDAQVASAVRGYVSQLVSLRKQQVADEAYSQALAASEAAQWQQFVQQLEPLAGISSDEQVPSVLLEAVADQVAKEAPADVVGLCGALLEAWRAARQQAATRADQEVLHAVLDAVQASEQQAMGWSSRQRR
jgi:ankyrin repeat protein